MNNTDSVNTTVDADTWQLNALTEALGDLTLTVSESLSVGRGSDNDVVLGSKQVSRNHAVLSVLEGQLYVKDLDSSNGTFINDERIEGNKSHLLQGSDTIGFASFRFQVNAPVDEAEETEGLAPVAAESTAASTNTDEIEAAETVKEAHMNEESTVKEPVVQKTGIEEFLPTTDNVEPASSETATLSESPATAIKEEAVTTKQSTPTVSVDNDPLVEQPVVREEPAVQPEHDKTTKTELQEEADPEVLRAKQAATAQFSGTANLGQSRDLGTEGNNAMDQAVSNPANAGQVEKKPSGSWFIWVFLAILVIGLALWLFNMGGA